MIGLQRHPLRLVVGALVCLSVAVGVQVYLRLIAPAAPLNFDEAAHSLPGYYMLRDFSHLDARAFWGDFHIQTLWPPGFSILQAPFLALFGASDSGARLFAYVMLVLAMLGGVAVARELAPALAPLAGWISGVIALTAPGWLFVSSWAMQETPVAFVSMCVFWLFLRARRQSSIPHYAGAGVALYGLFLTKYNYAAFALLAIGVVDIAGRLGRWRRGGRVRSVAEFVALYAPLLAGLAFWFVGGVDIVPREVKWRDFAFFVTNENSGYDLWSAQNLLYYVRASGSWLMANPLFAALALVSAGWALIRLRGPGIAMLGLYFGIGFVLATLHPLKSDRYITPLFPALWLLSGLGAADLVKRAADRFHARSAQSTALVAAIAAAALGVVSWATSVVPLQPVWAGNAADDLRAAADQVIAWQQPGRPILIIGTFGELGPPLFEWRLRPRAEFADNPAIQYDAPPGDGSNLQRVTAWLARYPDAQVAVIDVGEGSVFRQTADMQSKNLWKQQLGAEFSASGLVPLAARRDLSASGISLRYYARP